MQRTIKDLVEKISRFFFERRRVPGRPARRRLVCESLEERRLLAVEPCVGECFLMEDLLLEVCERDAIFIEEDPFVPIAIPQQASAPPGVDELVAAANRVEIAVISESTLEPEADDADPFFEEFGVVINGQRYAPLTEWLARKAELDDATPTALLVGELNLPSPISYGALSGGSGGGDPPVYDINVTSSAISSCEEVASIKARRI